MIRHWNYRRWLCGATAVAVLIFGANLAAPSLVYAQPAGQVLLDKPKLTFTDSTGLKMKTSDLRKKDPAYVTVEQYYREGRISEAEYMSLTQMRVNSIGKMVGKLENWIGNNPEAKFDELFGGVMKASGKMMDAIESDSTTSAQLAGATVDMLPPMLRSTNALIRDLDPAINGFANETADFGQALSTVIQNRPDTDFSPSEKRAVRDGAQKLSSYVRLNLPSNIGTTQTRIAEITTKIEDPATAQKLKDKVAKDIEIVGGADIVRRYIKAVQAGDEGEQMQLQTYMANMEAMYRMDHLPPLWSLEDEQADDPVPVPVTLKTTPKKPVKIGTIPPADPYEGLRVPQPQTQEVPKKVPKIVIKIVPKDKPKITPVTLTPIDPETGLPRPMVTHPEDRRNGGGGAGASGGYGEGGLIAYDTPFTVEAHSDTTPVSDGPIDTRHALPSEPTFHAGDGSFTREGQNGYYELPDGRLIIATDDHQLPPHHHVAGDGSFTVAGQNGYDEYEGEDTSVPPSQRTRHVAGDGSFTIEGQNGYDVADTDDIDPYRLSNRQHQSAEDGDFSPEDAFSAAAAEEAINRSRQQIQQQSDDAQEAWNQYADTVYYDEEGHIHSIPRASRVNDYQGRPVDNRSATQIDRDRGRGDPWHSFEPSNYDRGVEVADLEAIYAGYDIDNMPMGASGRSLSSAGTSMSSAGNSMRIDWTLPGYGPSTAQLALDRANGVLIDAANEWHAPTDWGGDDLGDHSIRVNGNGRSTDPALASLNSLRNQPGYDALYGALHGDNQWSGRPLAETNPDLARALYGPLWSDRPYRIQTGAGTQYGGFTSGIDVATLSGLSPSQLRMLTANGEGGLERLLAQPFNVLLTWGAGAYDLDLHMTGPLAEGNADRFHIYFAAKGKLDDAPYASLIKDCICNSGSEVILTSALVKGQVYRVSVFNYGNQSASSTNLSTASDAMLQIVRGGVATSVGNGTTIVGGHVLYTGRPTSGGAGNTWVAAEIDPNTGKIRAPNTIVQSPGSDNVH